MGRTSESWLIDLPFACYWIELRDGVVVKAPPIAYFMARDHWTIERVRHYAATKRGTITDVTPTE